MKKLIRKLKLPLIAMLSFILLTGCGSQIKEQLNSGIEKLNQGSYAAAKANFEDVLKKDPKNQEAKKLTEIIINYDNAKKEYQNENYKKAKEIIDTIPKEYEKYKIKEDINKLKSNIESKIAEIIKNDKSLETIENYIKDNKLNESKTEIDKINSNNLTKEQLEKFEAIKNELKIKNDKKDEEARKENEEKLKKKQAEDAKKQSQNSSKKIAATAPQKQGNIHYANKNFKIQMELPADWRGKYIINEYKNGLAICYKTPKNKNVTGVLLFIEKLEDGEREHTFDDSCIKNINGKRFQLGVQTDIGTNAPSLGENEIYDEYKKLVNEKTLVYKTLRAYK